MFLLNLISWVRSGKNVLYVVWTKIEWEEIHICCRIGVSETLFEQNHVLFNLVIASDSFYTEAVHNHISSDNVIFLC